MHWFANLPIKRKLTLVIMFSCAVVLLLACGVLAAYQLFDFRQTLVRNTTVLADVLAENTRAALAFQDNSAAQQILFALESEPNVSAACLYTDTGEQFATYTRSGTEAAIPEMPAKDGHWFVPGHLILFRPVVLNNKHIGTIFLQTDLKGLYDRLRLFGGIALLVLLGSFLVALAIATPLQRPISQPILALAETARLIAEHKDYAVRVPPQGRNEIGVLADAFNQMLTRIHEQNQSLLHMAAIIESTNDAIISKNLDGIITSWNHGAEKLFGYSAQEVIGKPIQMLYPPERADEELQILARIARGENIDHFETVQIAKSGKRIYISTTLSPVRNNQGQIVGASKIAHDITERKLVENRLQAEMARLALLNQITRAVGERQDLHSIFQVVIRTLEEHLPIDFSCICLYEQAANMLTVTSVGVRSEALAMELALTEHARVEIDQNGLFQCVHGRLVYEPDISGSAFPFPQRLVQGGLRSFVAAPISVESKVFGVLIAARRQPEGFSSGECEFLRQLSEHVGLAAHQAQLYEALQKAYDDLRLTQQAIMQQERLKALGQMASGIAHDINNAISPVMLYTETLLEKEPNLSARARDYLTTIQRAIEDVTHTVARMREFYRQREAQLALVPVKLNEIIQQVIDLSRARWSDMPQQRGIFIKIETSLAPELPSVMGVESEIREALINLVFNAVDAMPEGGTLTLRTKISAATPPLAQLEVGDTGVGMDEDIRRRCFEPFFTTKGERGTGLGLAMVYGIVQRHNADIEIESAVGKGTTLRLSFPVPVAPTGGLGKAAGSYMLPARLRILVVDDDPLLIKSLRDTLESDGHVITTASGGREGIEAFGKAQASKLEPVAVVITDLGMPYVDGRQVADAVKKISPTTPVILLTGWGQRLVAEGDVPPHVDRVLNKPPKLRELREALAQCLQSAKS